MALKKPPRSWKFLEQETFACPEYPELVVQICARRGLKNREEIESFLNPSLAQLGSPDLLKDMKEAVARVIQAREKFQKIRVFGDYDVDGTSGAALLTWVFREFKFDFDVTQPDRFKDGYGLNPGAVLKAKQDGIDLLITVDCGISSFDAAQLAQELQVDLIVLDHHQVDPIKGIPKAFAVVNPQRQDCPSQFKELCGCALAFYFAMALRREARRLEWFKGQQEPNLKQHLDLVTLATAADCVPLRGENHILLRHGMEVLRTSQKPGLKALMHKAGLRMDQLSPSHLGFFLGPRINASGRLGSAQKALDLLCTKSESIAQEFADQLEEINRERMDLQNQIWDEIKQRVRKKKEQGSFPYGIVEASKDWHEGVVGIVASRVSELFQMPSIILSILEDGIRVKGSARSFGGQDVLAALNRCSHYLLGFGGHKHAAGLSLNLKNLDAFTDAFNEALCELKKTQEKFNGELLIDARCEIEDLNFKAVMGLEHLGPFGPGHAEPVVCLKGIPSEQRLLKGRHLKFKIKGNQGSIEAIWFNAMDWMTQETLEERVWEWAVVPELNRYQGSVKTVVRVKDARFYEARAV